jgi:hypothetical protein
MIKTIMAHDETIMAHDVDTMLKKKMVHIRMVKFLMNII